MTHGCTVHGLTLHRTFFNVRNRKVGAPRRSDEDSHSMIALRPRIRRCSICESSVISSAENQNGTRTISYNDENQKGTIAEFPFLIHRIINNIIG